ncbi:YceI family protein [Frankia sp. Mgl5]|uniref:YceI family protein n=1 Tax=Frankia sp. Mgl5 TaxID=2933793 RepID=UPI00200ED5D8|nr:YceI family protein [Frankia sp. Mgl5]MCK9929747.1 YceI family protein [Frankia sp. Mgl5]
MTTQLTGIPGYVVGTWTIDPAHSSISFVIRHLGVSKVRGRFDDFSGSVVTAAHPLGSSVTATIRTASLNTANDQRDEQVRGADFLNVEVFPEMTFTSTGTQLDGDAYLVDGELSLRGVTRPVVLRLEVNGFGAGFGGTQVAGFSASTEISRADFGVTGGPSGAVLGDKVKIELEIEAVSQS